MGHVFPRWLALAGIPVTVALAGSYFYFPFFGCAKWGDGRRHGRGLEWVGLAPGDELAYEFAYI
jgi:hypothetical protein